MIIYKIYSRKGCFDEWAFNYTCLDQAFHFKQKQLHGKPLAGKYSKIVSGRWSKHIFIVLKVLFSTIDCLSIGLLIGEERQSRAPIFLCMSFALNLFFANFRPKKNRAKTGLFEYKMDPKSSKYPSFTRKFLQRHLIGDTFPKKPEGQTTKCT